MISFMFLVQCIIYARYPLGKILFHASVGGKQSNNKWLFYIQLCTGHVFLSKVQHNPIHESNGAQNGGDWQGGLWDIWNLWCHRWICLFSPFLEREGAQNPQLSRNLIIF